jgi:sialidase-1
MMLRMSYDDGKTWPTARVIYPGTSAYSDVAALPDGRVAVLFEKDYYRSINLAILPAITE